MKKSILTLTLVSFAFAYTSCRDAEPQKETVIIEKEVHHDVKVEKEDPGLLEKAAAEVDKEVNKEVSEEIDKIGDDQ